MTKKILYIDTNIFIQCSFLENKDGDTISSLEKVQELLTGGVHLLLPEITRLEIDSCLLKKEQEFLDAIKDVKEGNRIYNGLGKNITKDLNDAISSVMEERLRNYDRVKATIGEIFTHSNIINVPLSSEHLASAYIYSITKRKPFSKKGVGLNGLSPSIQSDCLNVLAIKEALSQEEEGEYHFYFCSRDGDFYIDSIGENANKLHDDILNILNIKAYNRNLFQLLKDEFGVSFEHEEISEFNESPFFIDSTLVGSKMTLRSTPMEESLGETSE